MLQFPLWKKMVVFFICAASILFTLPNFSFLGSVFEKSNPPAFLQNRVKLGLDLQGGAHILLEVDIDAYMKEHMEGLMEQIKGVLRKNSIGYKDLHVENNHIICRINTSTLSKEVITEHLMDALPELLREGLIDLKGEDELHITYKERPLTQMKASIMRQSLEIVERRIDAQGMREPVIQLQGDHHILVQVPGLEDPQELKDLLGKTAKLTFHFVNQELSANPPMALPSGMKRLFLEEKDNLHSKERSMVIDQKIVLSGDTLTHAHVSFDHNQQPVISFQFNARGAKQFAEITRNNVGKLLAIVLDNKILSMPQIKETIAGGSGVITGHFTTKSANMLALLLRAGALPAPLKIVEERMVGPSLGIDSIKAGASAMGLGLVFVMGFMFLTYGRLGLYSNIALMFNLLIITSVLSLLGATLTFPGIAGMVLTMGMAVDANVLIFERMREEIQSCKTVILSIDQGFKRAYATILDSNITTLIAAGLLYGFGTGSIKGFAATLSIGITASLFTSIMLTRFLIIRWYRRARPQTLCL